MIITDTLRGKYYQSLKVAWECYFPEVSYSTFYYKMKNGKIPYLKMTGEEPNNVGHFIVDAESGQKWYSVTECAEDLGVTRTAVQLSIKRKNRCRGHKLEILGN